MSNLVWTENTTPDRPGIWAYRFPSGKHAFRQVTEASVSSWCSGTWVFICDLPTIVDPPKYREVTAADCGEWVEQNVGCGRDLWSRVRFLNFSSGEVAYERQDGSIGLDANSRFRILDDGQAKQPPQELWAIIFGKLVNAMEREDAVGVRRGIELAIKAVNEAKLHWDGQGA